MCFSLWWLVEVLIWLVCVCGLVLILKIVLPPLLRTTIGEEGLSIAVRVINVIVWMVVVIALIVLIANLISCLAFGGLFPLRH